MEVRNKVIVVTGGGSGIGRALVLNLLKKGAKVAAVDINEATLQETYELAGNVNGNMSLHVLNITDRDAVKAFPEAVIEKHGAVDGLINNAGIIQPFIPINDLEFDAIERVLNVNLFGVINMTKAFLPYLISRPEAHVVNVSSMGGFFPFPGQVMYGASKAGVKLLTEGLYSELTDTNVDVTVVFPGAVATNINSNSGLESRGEENPEASVRATSPDDAAEMIVNGIQKKKFRVLVGNDARLIDILYRINPRWATQFMYKQMQKMMANA